MSKTPAKVPTVKVKLAVVGIYFGTVPKDPKIPPGATGIAASKFRDAPEADVPAASSIKHLADAIKAKVMNDPTSGCSDFILRLTSTTGMERITGVGAEYNGKGPGGRRGKYFLGDHTPKGDEIINPKLAWQTYHYDSELRQKQADGFNRNRYVTSDTNFEDGDIIIFRCVLIATAPINFEPAPNLSAGPKLIS
jgi:hypothetical protein